VLRLLPTVSRRVRESASDGFRAAYRVVILYYYTCRRCRLELQNGHPELLESAVSRLKSPVPLSLNTGNRFSAGVNKTGRNAIVNIYYTIDYAYIVELRASSQRNYVYLDSNPVLSETSALSDNREERS